MNKGNRGMVGVMLRLMLAFLLIAPITACSSDSPSDDEGSSTKTVELSAEEKKRQAALEASEKNVAAMLEASKTNDLRTWRACFTRASQLTVTQKKHTPPVASYKILSSTYLPNGEVEVRAEQTSPARTTETYTWTLKKDGEAYKTYLMTAKIGDQEIVINSER